MATRLTDSEIHGLQSFSVEDTNNIGTRWKRWLRSFELYAGGKGVSQPEQKKALLLHTAGSRVQDIFFTLTLEQGEEGDTAYDKTVKTLNKRFTPQDHLSKADTLGYFDKNAPTQIITDASPVGLGAVLVQKQGHEYRVISYASRSLDETERRYSQTEKEALAIVWAFERFHVYLYGVEVELLTDHKPLECIYSQRSKPCARIERWVLRLQPYRYKVTYIPGHKNIADSLSRLLGKGNVATHKMSDEYVYFAAKEATPDAMTTREIERVSENDPELIDVRCRLLDGKWDNLKYKEYLFVKSELCAIGQLVLRGTRIVIPSELRGQVLELGHEGHPSIVGMKQRLRHNVWWPGIDKDIEKHCKNCYGCQLVGQPSKPEPMSRSELPSGPWQHLAADLLGPLPSGDFIFVLVDYYSRWFEIEVTKVTTSEKITRILSKMFVTHGLPVSIQTDNGPQFISEHFRSFMQLHGIIHRHTTPLWPQANGEVERQNRSIMKRVRIAHAQGRDWKSDLDDYLIMYRSTAHTVTGVSPSKLLFGREMRTKLPNLWEFSIDDVEVRDRDRERKEKSKVYADQRRNAQESDLKECDRVLVRQEKENKLSTPFNPNPMTVVERNGNAVLIESDQGAHYKRNITHVKKFNENHVQKECSQSEIKENNFAENEITDKFDMLELDVPDNNVPENVCVDASQNEIIESRPVRTRKMPARFNDFIVG
ncbi:hypothetical protein FSP39_020533 [Pinctada imbricata]|uniref:Integrase catalytic domain-containing protein n=1 Tax=Pinctada imbricata TaxID=66713 RepID=A0AA88Y468_PINIB|nr:hypothetical protein FSP39_020533 [Pinctada imbricata]